MFITTRNNTIEVHDDTGVVRSVKTIPSNYKIMGAQLVGDTIVVSTNAKTLVYKKDTNPSSYAFYLYRQY